MEIVHGLNAERCIVEKELHVTEEKGAFLRYEDVDTVIEPNIKVWNKIYRPDDPPEGFKNAFYQLTNECNKNCEYCYNRYLLLYHPCDTTVKQLVQSTEEFIPVDTREIVPYRDYIYDGYHPTISFIGGEPTVADTLIPLVWYIHGSRNNRMYIYTNGINLLKKDYLKQFPNTNQILWSLSVDKFTKHSFIKRVMDKIQETNHEISFNIIIGQTEETIQNNLAMDQFIRENYDPEEIRYRAIIDQRMGVAGYLSDILKFIERARGITLDHYIENAFMGHGGFVCSLKPEFSDDPKKGKVAAAVLPVWGQTFAEAVSKWGSFIMNTTYMNAPGECHMNSPELYRWRMSHPEICKSEATEIIWGKQNPYC